MFYKFIWKVIQPISWKYYNISKNVRSSWQLNNKRSHIKLICIYMLMWIKISSNFRFMLHNRNMLVNDGHYLLFLRKNRGHYFHSRGSSNFLSTNAQGYVNIKRVNHISLLIYLILNIKHIYFAHQYENVVFQRKYCIHFILIR